MKRVLIAHTGDLHGNVDGLARAATLVERLRAENDCPVIYVDAGDVEETTTWISNVTKGAAMHRLLSAAGCQAACVGNAAWLRYGPQVIAAHADEASYPLLLANLRERDGSVLPGASETALLDVDGARVGLIGITAPMDEIDILDELGLTRLDEVELVGRLAGELRGAGADHVVLLSHLGLAVPESSVDDRRLVPAVADMVDAVIGGHSHDVLPNGELLGGTVVSHAGSHAAYVGVLELGPDGARARLVEVSADLPPHPGVLEALASVEPEIEALLGEVIGELPRPLDHEEASSWFADLLRERTNADVALVTPWAAFTGSLPGGALTRGALWEVCGSSANPGVAELPGRQLLVMLERGLDPEFAAVTPRPLRGRPRGLLQISGSVDSIHSDGVYRVAATDWELEPYGGLVEREWGLDVEYYNLPTILREFIEESLGMVSA
jgi:2',3'-cyclic-nucleotide 2'-phosphodiesterase (5'-nucleotidase family)